MKKFNILFILIFILSLSLVHANWYQNGNSNYYYAGSVGQYNLYGTNAPISLNLEDQEITSIVGSGSYYPILSYDYNNDGYKDYLYTSPSSITLYDYKFNIIDSYSFSTSINTAPKIGNINQNDYLDISIYTDGKIVVLEYNPINENFEIINVLDLDGPTKSKSHTFCKTIPSYNENITCFGNSYSYSDYNHHTKKFYKNTFDKNNFSLINKTSSEILGGQATLIKTDSINYISYGVSDNSLYIPYVVFIGHYLRLIVLDENLNTVLDNFNVGHGNSSFYKSDVFIGNVGNNIVFVQNKNYNINKVISLAGEVILNLDDYNISNFVAVDYNKDGYNEFCYLINLYDNTTKLKCHDGTGSLLQSFEINSSNLTKNNFVMSDINNQSSYLGFATIQGLYGLNDSDNSIYQIYDTGYNSSYDGHLLATRHSTIKIPTFIYYDNSFSLMMTYSDLISSCGDGICNTGENSFNCPSDCDITDNEIDNIIIGSGSGLIDEGDICKINSDCKTGLCSYNKCSFIVDKNTYCNDDSDCLSDECLNNRCTEPTYIEKLDYSKSQLFGSDEGTGNFISIFLSFGIPAMIIMGSGGSVLSIVFGILTFFILMLLFAIIGWLSGWIIFILILLLIVIIIISTIIKLGTGE